MFELMDAQPQGAVINHVIDCIAAAAAHSHHLDHCALRLGIH